MRRHFYIGDFFDLMNIEDFKNADPKRYAVLKFSYKPHPMFIISEDDSLSDSLATIEKENPDWHCRELMNNDLLLFHYYKTADEYQVIGNENMAKDSSVL